MYYKIWYIFIYSLLGWCSEVAYAAIIEKKFVNRGFLSGPVCPIYGFGAALIYTLLMPFKDTWLVLFLLSVVITSVLELVTGYALKMIFHQKWWDYSDRFLNVGGYICLKFSILWGVVCVAAVRLIVPFTDLLVSIIPDILGIVLICVFSVIMLLDMTATVMTIIGINKELKALSALTEKLKENSDKMGERVAENAISLKEKYDKSSEIIHEKKDEFALQKELLYLELSDKNRILKKRLLSAFPNMKSVKYDKEILERIREDIINFKRKIRKSNADK